LKKLPSTSKQERIARLGGPGIVAFVDVHHGRIDIAEQQPASRLATPVERETLAAKCGFLVRAALSKDLQFDGVRAGLPLLLERSYFGGLGIDHVVLFRIDPVRPGDSGCRLPDATQFGISLIARLGDALGGQCNAEEPDVGFESGEVAEQQRAREPANDADGIAGGLAVDAGPDLITEAAFSKLGEVEPR
jgi:hypothetical protein